MCRCADDTSCVTSPLLADSEQGLQAIVNVVDRAGQQGLRAIVNVVDRAGQTFSTKMKATKTTTLIITKKTEKPTIHTTIDDADIEHGNNFRYLDRK